MTGLRDAASSSPSSWLDAGAHPVFYSALALALAGTVGGAAWWATTGSRTARGVLAAGAVADALLLAGLLAALARPA